MTESQVHCSARYSDNVLTSTSTAVFACHSAACAPPPPFGKGTGGSKGGSKGGASGTGGSLPAGKSGAGGGAGRTMHEVATHQLKRMGMTGDEVKSLMDGSAPDSLKQVARPWLKKQGFTPGQIHSMIGRDSGASTEKLKAKVKKAVQSHMEKAGVDRAHGTASSFGERAENAEKRGNASAAKRFRAAREAASEVAMAKDIEAARSIAKDAHTQAKWSSADDTTDLKGRKEGAAEAFRSRFGTDWNQ